MSSTISGLLTFLYARLGNTLLGGDNCGHQWFSADLTGIIMLTVLLVITWQGLIVAEMDLEV